MLAATKHRYIRQEVGTPKEVFLATKQGVFRETSGHFQECLLQLKHHLSLV